MGFVILIGAVAIGLVIFNSGEPQEQGLPCGSVGRLVATAEAIATSERRGLAYVRIGTIESYGDGETLSANVSRSDEMLEGTGFTHVANESYQVRGPETVCQVLSDLTARFDWDGSFDQDRAEEIESAYQEKPLGAANFRVMTRFRNGDVTDSRTWWSVR